MNSDVTQDASHLPIGSLLRFVCESIHYPSNEIWKILEKRKSGYVLICDGKISWCQYTITFTNQSLKYVGWEPITEEEKIQAEQYEYPRS